MKKMVLFTSVFFILTVVSTGFSSTLEVCKKLGDVEIYYYVANGLMREKHNLIAIDNCSDLEKGFIDYLVSHNKNIDNAPNLKFDYRIAIGIDNNEWWEDGFKSGEYIYIYTMPVPVDMDIDYVSMDEKDWVKKVVELVMSNPGIDPEYEKKYN